LNIKGLISEVCILAVTLFLSPISHATDIEETVLYKYVHEDNGYTPEYSPRFESQAMGLDIKVYNVASQIWQGHQIYNQVYVAMPNGVPKNSTHAVVVIAGGSYKKKFLLSPSQREEDKFKRKLSTYATIAKRLDTPIVVVRHVPFQRMPLCPETFPKGRDGNSEDDLIACTFKKFLDSDDDTWPALLPMTKSVHVALDVAQEVFADEWDMKIDTFTALGASKRGWATFLSAAIDDRITGAIPIVIDMLNLKAHLNLQVAAWGTHSRQIQDYDTHGILSRFDSPRGEELINIVDPFTYKNEYDIPMLIVLGTNDEYWPVDSANLYYHDLGLDKYLLYLPNQGHKAADYDRLLSASEALHSSVQRDIPLADIQWSFYHDDDGLALSFTSSTKPNAITLWAAKSADRDFRNESFEATEICAKKVRRAGPQNRIRRGGECARIEEIRVAADKRSCGAYFIEAWFEHDGFKRYPLTSTQYVTGGKECLSTQQLARQKMRDDHSHGLAAKLHAP
jgi:PhoPQ-activated pathogenicity-related protein